MSRLQLVIAAGAVCAVTAGMLVVVSKRDTSAPLTNGQLQKLTEWANATGSDTVLDELEGIMADGQVTRREKLHLHDVAKAEPPPYGLASDLRR